MSLLRTTTRWIGALALAGSLAACAASPPRGNADPRAVPGAGDDVEATPPPRTREPRALDPRLDVDNLGARLSPYIESIGAGFGAGM
jgi:hypothetical protein